MDITDLHKEMFTNRKVMIYTKTDITLVGRLLFDDTLNNMFKVYMDNNASRYISSTNIECIFDMDPAWNECPSCKAKAGEDCVTETHIHVIHGVRIASALVDTFKQDKIKKKHYTPDSLISSIL